MGARIDMVEATPGEPVVWSRLRNSYDRALGRSKSGAWGDRMRVGHNTWIDVYGYQSFRHDKEAMYTLVYHRTELINALPNGLTMLDHGGWCTSTTLHRLRMFLRGTGYELVTAKSLPLIERRRIEMFGYTVWAVEHEGRYTPWSFRSSRTPLPLWIPASEDTRTAFVLEEERT